MRVDVTLMHLPSLRMAWNAFFLPNTMRLGLLDAYWSEKEIFFSSASRCMLVLCAFKLNKNSEWGGKV